MPWCDDCDRYLAPSAVTPDGAQLDQAELGPGVVDHHRAATVRPALVIQVVFAAFLPRLYDDGARPGSAVGTRRISVVSRL
jgi:hypothetical protein